MSRTKYFIQEGFIVKKYNNDDKDVPGLFSLDKWFKKELERFNVVYFDPCCTDGFEEFLPARLNNTTGETEFYDPVTEEWTPVGDWTPTTTTTTTTVAPTTTTTSTTSTTTTTTTVAPTTTTTTTLAPTTTTTTTV